MKKQNTWILPAGIEEVLPPDAYEFEMLCRKIMDQFGLWGYELVMPPLAEYLDSLLTGAGDDLELKTFKITDQLTGRMMGIRADITPQVARIDSHKLGFETPTRLCYRGSVLHTRPDGPGGTRAPLQIGAEIYGHAGVESDAEILSLMLITLQTAGLKNVHVDIGHAGIYRKLIKKLDIQVDRELVIINAMQRKAVNELKRSFAEWSISSDVSSAILSLTELNGDRQILDKALTVFRPLGDDIVLYVEELMRIADLVAKQVKDASLFFDLADCSGYKYHNGIMFTTFIHGQGQGIAFGGRYDGLGKEFGRARSATGFSIDINSVYKLVSPAASKRTGIFAPNSEIPGLDDAISELRKKGERVIAQLPGQTGSAKDMGCDRELYLDGGRWSVRDLKL